MSGSPRHSSFQEWGRSDSLIGPIPVGPSVVQQPMVIMEKADEPTCTPGSVAAHRYRPGRWRPFILDHCYQWPRATYPLTRASSLRAPAVRSCSGRGLPSRDGHPPRWWALTPPFHPYPPVFDGRSTLCGTVPRVTPGGRYPPPFPVEPGRSSWTRPKPAHAAAWPTHSQKESYPESPRQPIQQRRRPPQPSSPRPFQTPGRRPLQLPDRGPAKEPNPSPI